MNMIHQQAVSLRPFIGAKDYDVSRQFYRELGFEETVLFPDMCVFTAGSTAFYLQRAYVRQWIDNLMIFMEVKDVEGFWQNVVAMDLPSRFEHVRLVPIRYENWGREFFIHDPSGILWHFGQFNKQ